MQTIFRKLTHDALAQEELYGAVIDLGGTNRAEYASFLKGDFKRLSFNINTECNPDFVGDLEKVLPFENNRFDGALLINVLEHIYHTSQLLLETARILKSGGKLIVTVPFMIAIHPSPKDYYRFSTDALEAMFADAGFTNIKILPIGSGVFMARHALLSRLIPHTLQLIVEYPMRYHALIMDKLWQTIANILRKKYKPSDYPLGFIITAKKI